VLAELVLLVGDTVHTHDDVAGSSIVMIDMFIPDHLDELVVIVLKQAGSMRVSKHLSVVRNVLLIKNSAVSGYGSPSTSTEEFSLSADENMNDVLSRLLSVSNFLDNRCGIDILVDPVTISGQIVLKESISVFIASLVVHQGPHMIVVNIIGLVECITQIIVISNTPGVLKQGSFLTLVSGKRP